MSDQHLLETAEAMVRLLSYWRESPFPRFPSVKEVEEEISKHRLPSVSVDKLHVLVDKWYVTRAQNDDWHRGWEAACHQCARELYAILPTPEPKT